MTPFEAIFQRQSIRHFRKDPVPGTVLHKIENFEAELIPIFPDVKMETKVYRAEEYHSKMPALFGVQAPYYLAVYAQTLEGSRSNAGNLLEQIALYLHSRGIGTCFVGGMRPPKGAPTPEGMEFVIMLAFGLPKGELNRPAEKAHRESMERLCVYKQEPLRETQELIEAARLAPSSLNSPPWTFVVYRNRLHIFEVQKRQGGKRSAWQEINMGIMMAHILMAAEEYWIDVTMTHSDNLAEKPVANYQDVGSVLVKP